MSKNKKNNKVPDPLLNEKQKKQLQDMVNNMLDIAANVVEEYKDLDISELQELSGSITQIHETSPFLNEIFEGDSWKRVITNLEKVTNKKDKKDASE